MSTFQDNLPADRMMLVESMNSEDNVLLNVDEIAAVRRYDDRSTFYVQGQSQPYNRGLTVTLHSGAVYKVETKMTLREFEIERAKKFTPVAPEKTEPEKLADEIDWNVDEVSTQWSYLHPHTLQWVDAPYMNVAIDEARRLGSRYRAVMHRSIHKEWDTDGD